MFNLIGISILTLFCLLILIISKTKNSKSKSIFDAKHFILCLYDLCFNRSKPLDSSASKYEEEFIPNFDPFKQQLYRPNSDLRLRQNPNNLVSQSTVLPRPYIHQKNITYPIIPLQIKNETNVYTNVQSSSNSFTDNDDGRSFIDPVQNKPTVEKKNYDFNAVQINKHIPLLFVPEKNKLQQDHQNMNEKFVPQQQQQQPPPQPQPPPPPQQQQHHQQQQQQQQQQPPPQPPPPQPQQQQPPPPPQPQPNQSIVPNTSEENMNKNQYLVISLSQLSLTQPIGGGAFGQVWKGTWRGTPVAVKILSPSCLSNIPHKVLNAFDDEINILASLRHPNICLFMGACLESSQRAIVTELVSRGSLWDALRTPQSFNSSGGPLFWPEWVVQRVLDGTCKGLSYLHSNCPPIVHRDLKSANL